MSTDSSNVIDLWTCLHDGMLKAIRSDLSARSLTFVIESPFHVEFHKLPNDTYYKIVGDEVRSVEAFVFEPWPDAIEPSRDTPWEEAQKQRRLDAEKGRLISSDWSEFVSQIGTDKEYIIMSAEIVRETSHDLFRIGVNSYSSSQFRDIEIRAAKFRFYVGGREYSVKEFAEFGNDYWDNWAARKPNAATDNKEEK